MAIKHTKTYIHFAPKNYIVHFSYSNQFDFHFHAHKEHSLFSMTSQTFIATQSWVLHAMPATHKSLQFNLWGNCPRDGESFPVLAWQRRVRVEFDLSALDWNREGPRDPRRSCNLDWPQQMDGQQSDSCCNQFSLESDMNQRSSGAHLCPVWVCL